MGQNFFGTKMGLEPAPEAATTSTTPEPTTSTKEGTGGEEETAPENEGTKPEPAAEAATSPNPATSTPTTLEPTTGIAAQPTASTNEGLDGGEQDKRAAFPAECTPPPP